MNSFRMICRTFIDWLAQSMRFFPMSARSRFLTSQFTCIGEVDILLLVHDCGRVVDFLLRARKSEYTKPGEGLPGLPPGGNRGRRHASPPIVSLRTTASPPAALAPAGLLRWPAWLLCRSLPR